MPFLKPRTVVHSVIVGVLTLSGCQFGNKNTTQLTGYDTISGYYASLPQTITFQAQIGTSATRTSNGTITQMPDFLKGVMANPTLLYFDDPIAGIGSLRGHANTAAGIPTKIQDKLGAFGVSTGGYADVSGCRFRQDIVNAGTFSQAATTSVIAGLTVRGNISLDYSVTYSLTGLDVDCDSMRASFQSCYVDDVGCSADPQSIFYRAFIQQVFDPFVHSGIMTGTEIGSTRSLNYHATYQ